MARFNIWNKKREKNTRDWKISHFLHDGIVIVFLMSWVECWLLTPGLSKGIQCHEKHLSHNLPINKSDTRPKGSQSGELYFGSTDFIYILAAPMLSLSHLVIVLCTLRVVLLLLCRACRSQSYSATSSARTPSRAPSSTKRQVIP